MYPSAAALWLDSSLAGFDHLFLSIQHWFAEHAGGILTPLMRAISFLGEKGWPFFLLALLFILFAKTRDLGVCIFGAVCCGALISNIILKDMIARIRPFLSGDVEYELWWMAAGSVAEDGFSFPSGHVTACAAGMTAITLMRGKKWIVPSVIAVLLMMISRTYLMAHYPSDVVAAMIIGVLSGVIAWVITQLIFRFLRRKRSKVPFFAFLLDFDIRDIFSGKSAKRGAKKPAARKAPAADEAPAADDDVKTYPAKRRGAAAAEAAGDEDVKVAAPAVKEAAPEKPAAPARTRRAVAADTESARPAASARTGGRHALPEGAAKKKAPANYQGKH